MKISHYAEIISSVIAASGCQISESQLLQTAFSGLSYLVELPSDAAVRKQFFQEYVKTGYQIEGYEIGLLSLLALRAQGTIVGLAQYSMGRDYFAELQSASTNSDKVKIMTDLQTELKKVRTPAELLLHDVTPISSPDDQKLLDLIRQAAL